MRIYRVVMEPEVRASAEAAEDKAEKKPRPTRMVALGIVILITAVAIIGYFYLPPFSTRVEVASKEKMAYPLPDKPSIAVLPFVNMSEDPKEGYFSDGITEEIITALSKVPYLFVITRNSTLTYEGKPVKIKQVSEELAVDILNAVLHLENEKNCRIILWIEIVIRSGNKKIGGQIHEISDDSLGFLAGQ